MTSYLRFTKIPLNCSFYGHFSNSIGFEQNFIMPMVSLTELRMGQYRDDHRDGAPHFNPLRTSHVSVSPFSSYFMSHKEFYSM